MKNEEIFHKAIEKAVKNGWWYEGIRFSSVDGITAAYLNEPEHIIFSHDFAKAFWGITPRQEWHTGNAPKPKFLRKILLDNWQYHLQQLVLEEEPLKYIAKFL